MPSWSLVIPARDEETRLPRLLRSLMLLQHPPNEVVVVDDGSSDKTASVAKAHGAQVLTSDPLPEGWRGKNWACHQGVSRTTGAVLVFLDADTWLTSADFLLVRPGMALSLLPHHEVVRMDESASLFFNLAMAVGTMPGGLVGQSLVIHRSDYEASGGHEAVRNQILENFFLAQRLRRVGCEVCCLSGRGRLAFRMYSGGWRELYPGWIKGFASGAAGTPPGRLLLIVAWMIGLVLPWVAMATAMLPLWACLLAGFLAALQVALNGRRVGNFPLIAALGYPIPLGCFFGMFAISMIKKGRQVSWKGREINAH